MKRRGIVLELKDRHAIVLTPDGDFCRIPRAENMDVGVEVTFDDVSTALHTSQSFWKRGSRQSVRYRRLVSGIAAAAVIGAGIWTYTGILHPQTAEAYAWVSLDVNPSVMLEVDKNLTVRDVVGTDSDGKAMVSQLRLKGLTLSDATTEVLNYANNHHLLAPQSGILVGVTPLQTNVKPDTVSVAAQSAVTKAIQSDGAVKSIDPAVFTVSVPQSIFKAATNAHISPGKLMSVLVAAQEGQQAGLLDIKGQEIVHVWSNPQAQKAALKIGSSDLSQLTQVLQNLAKSQAFTSGNETVSTEGANQASQGGANSSDAGGRPTGNSSQASNEAGPGNAINMILNAVNQVGGLSGDVSSQSTDGHGNPHGHGQSSQGNPFQTGDHGQSKKGGTKPGQGQSGKSSSGPLTWGNDSSNNSDGGQYSNTVTGSGTGQGPDWNSLGSSNFGGQGGDGFGKRDHGHNNSNTDTHGNEGHGHSGNTVTVQFGNHSYNIPLRVSGTDSSQYSSGSDGNWGHH